MKTRNSLVSNSSSASFIVTWKCLDPEETDKKEVINQLFGYGDKSLKLNITNNTIQLKSGYFRTAFFISMLNEITDFGPDAGYLILSLYTNSNFEIADARVESDN